MPAGRPVTINVKENKKDYMLKYYYDHKKFIQCEGCKCYVDNGSFKRHLLTKKHQRVMEMLNQKTEDENLEKN